MTKKNNPIPEDEVIDLSDLGTRMGDTVSNLGFKVYLFLEFLKRNMLWLLTLAVIGVGLGFWADSTQKTYDHKIMLIPNFGSVDYLYEKVTLLDAKRKEKDSVFLQSIGLPISAKMGALKIEPILDPYTFVRKSEMNFDLFKLLSDNGEPAKIVEDPVTSKHYTMHMLSFSTRYKISHKTVVAPLVGYFNDSDYFTQIRKEYVQHVDKRFAANERTISQIDNFLDGISSGTGSAASVYINENTQLNDVIQTKSRLVNEQGELLIEKVNISNVIKESDSILNIENRESLNGKMKLVLPVLFIGLFLFVTLLKNFYKSQRRKAKALQS